MIDFKFLPAHFGLSLVVGILLGYFFDFPIKQIGIASSVLLILLVFSYFDILKRYSVPILFVLLTHVLLINYGILLSSKSKPENNAKHFLHFVEPQSVVDIAVIEELKHSDYYWKYIGLIISVDSNPTEGRIVIRIKKEDSVQAVFLNDRLITNQAPSEISLSRNPGAFNYNEYLKRKGIYRQLTLENNEFISGNSNVISLRNRALQFRGRMLSSLSKKGISKREFSVIQALLLGQKTDLSQETIASYQNAGAMHILAISGLHIGILMMIIKFILKPLGRIRFGKKIQWVLLMLSLWSFAFISGLSASVVRAASMFTLLSIGMYFGRSTQLSNYLFTGFFFSLLIKPLLVFDLGFQLSYMAVFAIIGIGPFLKALWSPKTKVLRYLWNLSVVSVSAQLGVLPLALYYFHHFSASFFLSSLCVIPYLGIVLGLGYFMLLLDWFGLLGETYIRFYEKLIKTLNLIVDKIGSLDNLSFHDVYFSLILLPVCYALIWALTYWIRYRGAKESIRLLAITICLFVPLLYIKWSTQNSSELIVFHQFKQSLLLSRAGDKVVIFRIDEGDKIVHERSIKDYRIEHLNLNITVSKLNKNFFRIGQERIMMVDYSGVDSDFGFQPDILILVNSPKLNLDRLLANIKPRLIVADGSNFNSLKSVWQKTAKKNQICFHDTAKRGAFIVEN